MRACINALKDAYLNALKFDGRTSRKGFGLFLLAYAAILFAAFLASLGVTQFADAMLPGERGIAVFSGFCDSAFGFAQNDVSG